MCLDTKAYGRSLVDIKPNANDAQIEIMVGPFKDHSKVEPLTLSLSNLTATVEKSPGRLNKPGARERQRARAQQGERGWWREQKRPEREDIARQGSKGNRGKGI